MAGVKTSESLLGDFRTDAACCAHRACVAGWGRRRVRREGAALADRRDHESRFLPALRRRAAVAGESSSRRLGHRWCPSLGALIIGLMARYGSEKIRGHGIPEALEAILLGRSLIEPKVAVLKPISSAISIGTGGPFGAEGPIIMTGGAFGSIIAQLFHLTAAERKDPARRGRGGGHGGGLRDADRRDVARGRAAAFRMAAAQFHPGRGRLPSSPGLLRVPLARRGPIFPVTPHGRAWALANLWRACGIGIVAGFGSGLLTAVVYFFEDVFQKLPIHWMWWPAIGALFVGIGGWFDPRVLGVGYELIDGLLNGHILGAAVARASRWQGARLVDRARLRHFGRRARAVADHRRRARRVRRPMAARRRRRSVGDGRHGRDDGRHDALAAHRHVFPARADRTISTRCPLCSAARSPRSAVTVLLMRRSILTEKLARRGQHIAREYSVDLFELMRVGDVMDRDFRSFPRHAAAALLRAHRERRSAGLHSSGDVARRRRRRPRRHHHARRYRALLRTFARRNPHRPRSRPDAR